MPYRAIGRHFQILRTENTAHLISAMSLLGCLSGEAKVLGTVARTEDGVR